MWLPVTSWDWTLCKETKPQHSHSYLELTYFILWGKGRENVKVLENSLVSQLCVSCKVPLKI